MMIKSFCRNLTYSNSSQHGADVIDENVNLFIKENNIKYSDIKDFKVSLQGDHPSHGGQSSGSKDGGVYLVYTLVIEKDESSDVL